MTLEIPEIPAIPETPDLKKYFNRAKLALAVNIAIIAIICMVFRPLVGSKMSVHRTFSRCRIILPGGILF